MTLKISTFLLLTFMLASCNYRIDKTSTNPTGPGGGEKTAENVPSFTTVKSLVLQDRCVDCHGKYANYAVVLGERGRIRDSVAAGRMPKDGPLTSEQRALLLAWLDAGAPEQASKPSPAATPPPPPPNAEPTATPVPTPTPTPFPGPTAGQVPTYDEVFAKVFKPRCMGCHEERAPILSDMSVAASSALEIKTSVLIPVGTKGHMPKGNRVLSEGELAWILAWVDGGAPTTPPPPADPQPTPTPTPTPEPPPAEEVIEPTYASLNATVFKSHECLKCHTNGEEGEFGLDMNSLAAIRRDDAKAATAKDPALSILVKAVTTEGRGRMPPGNRAPLSPKEIEVLKRWFELGLPE